MSICINLLEKVFSLGHAEGMNSLKTTKKLILGIETSCDDTSLALISGEGELLAHATHTDETLRKWGGVVPEIASRNHVAKLTPLLQEVLNTAGRKISEIDLIGVTTLPGLLGPLLTGLYAAKSLALMLQIPILPVNHLYAHLEAIHLTTHTPPLPYPYLGLLVSGGHGLFLLVKDGQTFELLGRTLDDAPGEAFDKGGRLMNLPYPAGRLIDEAAAKGNPKRFPFPIGLKDSADANLSYSGIKTALRYFIEKHPELIADHSSQDFFDLCASYQEAIIDALLLKLRYAFNLTNGNLPLVVGGGVACNQRLRQKILAKYPNKEVHFVAPAFCTDNGAMIANYAYRHQDQAIPFPQCLELDARGRYLEKIQHHAPK